MPSTPHPDARSWPRRPRPLPSTRKLPLTRSCSRAFFGASRLAWQAVTWRRSSSRSSLSRAAHMRMCHAQPVQLQLQLAHLGRRRRARLGQVVQTGWVGEPCRVRRMCVHRTAKPSPAKPVRSAPLPPTAATHAKVREGGTAQHQMRLCHCAGMHAVVMDPHPRRTWHSASSFLRPSSCSMGHAMVTYLRLKQGTAGHEWPL